MHHHINRIAHTTAFVTPLVEHWLEREIIQWVHHDGSIRIPIAPRVNRQTNSHTDDRQTERQIEILTDPDPSFMLPSDEFEAFKIKISQN